MPRTENVRSVRVVSLNLWNDQAEVERRVAVAADSLKALAPDVIGLQEVVSDASGSSTADVIARALEAHVHYDVVDPARPGGTAGNAIVSRFPIVRSASVALPSAPGDPRRVVWCELATPRGTLPFFTCHLSWEMWLSPRREAQVVAMDEFVQQHLGDLPPVLCGDFNASPDTDVVRFLTGRASLAGRGTYFRDCFARRRPDAHGHTWSERNPHAVRWVERNRRLDYIFVGPLRDDGWGAVLDARVVLDVPGHDGRFASDHFGVYAEIGQAPPEQAV